VHRQRLAVMMVVFIVVVAVAVLIVTGEVSVHHAMHYYISRGLAGCTSKSWYSYN
jgi:hypothetical protein